jgi:hypothetical protein
MNSKLLVVFVAFILISANLFGQKRTRINFSKDDPWDLYDDWDKYFFFPDEKSQNVYTVGKPFGDFYTAYFDTNEYAIFINPDSAKKGDTISLIFGMSITPNAPAARVFEVLFNYKFYTGNEDSLAMLFSVDGKNWEDIHFHTKLGEGFSVVSGPEPTSPRFPYKNDVFSLYRLRVTGRTIYYENNQIDTFLLKYVYYKNSDTFQRGFLISELEFEFVPGSSIDELQNGDIKIYPNPIDEYLEIDFSEKVNQGIYNIEFFDMHGRIVHSATLKNSRNKVNLSSLAKGIYLLKISDESGNVLVSKRVFKEQ